MMHLMHWTEWLFIVLVVGNIALVVLETGIVTDAIALPVPCVRVCRCVGMDTLRLCLSISMPVGVVCLNMCPCARS